MKKVESEIELVTQAVTAVRGTLERVVSAWETYNNCMTSLQSLLAQKMDSHAQHSLVEVPSALFMEKKDNISLTMKSKNAIINVNCPTHFWFGCCRI